MYTFPEDLRKQYESLTIPMAFYESADDGSFIPLLVTDGFCKLMELDHEQLIQHLKGSAFEKVHHDDIGKITQAVTAFVTGTGSYDVIYRSKYTFRDEYHYVHSKGEWQTMPDGTELMVVTYLDLSDCLDETSKLTSDYRLFQKDVFYTDPLTDLPNLNYFNQVSDEFVNTLRIHHKTPMLIFADVISMHYYNNQYGYQKGNELLKLIAINLKETFPDALIIRGQDDHFILVDAFEGRKETTDKLLSVNDNLRKQSESNAAGIKAGVYVYDDQISTVDALDRARNAIKWMSADLSVPCYFYDSAAEEKYKDQRFIIDNIDKAIENGWIQVYYQPIVRTANGKVCSVEALARWNDPVRGLLLPAAFIPVLEGSRLIQKLDMCVVKQVLKDLKENERKGNHNVPVSINFSRADFVACDLVQEICDLVDEARVDRKLINIEITESAVARDFDYMKEQIGRFRAQGFHVWMDDFGSGYSSLDVLQSIEFDLIKFDMGLVRRLDEGDNGKIILKDMLKMATSLGIDTICEGVETESQVRFLQDIGCSKLQGYYFMKPVPPERLLEMYATEPENGFEDPEQSAYYDALGSVNLYDLSFLANLDDNVIKNTFDTIPVGVMELGGNGDKARFIRSNQAFRVFMKRFFGFDLSDPETEYTVPKAGIGHSLIKAVEQYRSNGNRAFVDEEMEDGSTVHSFVRRIAVNRVTGSESVAIAVLSVKEPDENTTYADIARALAADYYNLFVIDLDTDDYTEYSSHVGDQEMSVVRHGKDFFESAKRDTMTRIYEEDRKPFLELFSKEAVLRDLDAQGVFTTTYRLIDSGTPMYVNMKITRLKGGNRIILGISIIDSQMKEREQYEELQREREAMVRVMALSDGYLSLFTVDPVTGKYTEYSSSDDFDSLGALKDGDDFFGQAYVDAFTYCYEEDRQRFQEQVTQENVLRVIKERGKFSINYRLIIRGRPRPVTLKAALFNEGGADKLVVGVRAWKERHAD